MFTGIVEEVGEVRYIRVTGHSGELSIQAKTVLEGTKLGDSIAVNGVCLTVTKMDEEGFCADVMAETVRTTSFQNLRSGQFVNLERAMAADGRFGGHIVSGHIDGIGQITDMTKEENATWISIRADQSILRGIVKRGSIAIDGISLTVAYVDDTMFKVSIIPHTAEETTLLRYAPGDIVNLETDIIGKYVERLLTSSMETTSSQSSLTMQMLLEEGF